MWCHETLSHTFMFVNDKVALCAHLMYCRLQATITISTHTSSSSLKCVAFEMRHSKQTNQHIFLFDFVIIFVSLFVIFILPALPLCQQFCFIFGVNFLLTVTHQHISQCANCAKLYSLISLQTKTSWN